MKMNEIDLNMSKINCWYEIGDWGTGICPELDKVGRCKYCSVYINSGRKLFDRIVSDELVDEWTEIVSKPKEKKEEKTVSVVIFRIGTEWLAINTHAFKEVIEKKFIHTIPYRTNKFFKGICNVNGELLLCFSIPDIFGLIKTDEDSTKMVVLLENNNRYVFEVDEFDSVASISEESIQKPPSTISKSIDAHINGIFDFKNQRIGLIDSNKLFTALKEGLIW